MSHFEVSTVPADGLAPLGARPSGDHVRTPYIYGTTEPAIKELMFYWFMNIYQLNQYTVTSSWDTTMLLL